MYGYFPQPTVPGRPVSGASFTPPSLPNLLAWYQFNTGLTGGANISQWNDQTANAFHLVQAVGGNQPANSSGTLTFDGVNDILAVTFSSKAQPLTVCLRFNPLVYGGGIYDGNASDSMFCNMTGGTPRYETYASGGGALGNTNLTVATFNSMVNIFNGASSSCRVGANAKTTGVNIGTSAITGLSIGGGEGATTFSNISVREFFVYQDAKSDSDVDSIIAYLNAI